MVNDSTHQYVSAGINVNDILIWNGSRWIPAPGDQVPNGLTETANPSFRSIDCFGTLTIYEGDLTATDRFPYASILFTPGSGAKANVQGELFYDGANGLALVGPSGLTHLLGLNQGQTITSAVWNGSAIDVGTYATGVLPPANGGSSAIKKDYLTYTNLGADRSLTNIGSTTTAGLYRVSFYMETTTADAAAGSVAARLYWNNNTQQENSSLYISPLDLTTVAAVHLKTHVIYHTAASTSAIQFLTFHGGTYGSAKYQLKVYAELLS
jgi:hypothetical protein